MENWILTLTIMPSVALLLLSTTSLTVALTTEIDHLLNHHEGQPHIIKKKLHQLKLLSWAKIALYLSAASLAFDGLVGAMFRESSMQFADTMWTAIFTFSIASLCVATSILIVYAIRAVSIRQNQFDMDA